MQFRERVFGWAMSGLLGVLGTTASANAPIHDHPRIYRDAAPESHAVEILTERLCARDISEGQLSELCAGALTQPTPERATGPSEPAPFPGPPVAKPYGSETAGLVVGSEVREAASTQPNATTTGPTADDVASTAADRKKAQIPGALLVVVVGLIGVVVVARRNVSASGGRQGAGNPRPLVRGDSTRDAAAGMPQPR